jgi:fatty acid desaturase
MGLYLAVLFWVNHIGMPVVPAEHDLSFVEQQVVGSRNVRCPARLDWFFGGLNYQIEHHLVPDCPGPRLRELSEFVRPLCEGATLRYREEGFGEALASVTRHVREIARTSKLSREKPIRTG